MNYEKILNLGVEKNIINEEQKKGLIDLFNQDVNEQKQTSAVVKVFYYFGGFIMLCAMIALMSHTIQNSTYTIILALGGLYAVIFLGAGEFLWRKNEKLPAGILYFLFIATFGFIVLDIEKMTGFFPHFADLDKYPNYWDMCRFPVIVLTASTIIANAVLQKYRQVSLLALPAIFCSYVLYMALLNWIYGQKNITTNIIFNSNLLFGIGLVIAGFIKDRLTKVDYSKWMYFFGAIGVWLSIGLVLSEFELSAEQTNFILFIFNLIYLFIGLLIRRKPFSIIGLLGIIIYILYLEVAHIKGGMILLTSAILLTGLIILYIGVIFSKNINKIEAFLENILPQGIKKFLPQNRE